MKFEVSAPGKVILHGEHAVVYGKAAIAASLSLRTRLTLVSHEDKVKLTLKSLGINLEWDKSILNNYSFQSCEGTSGSVTEINEDIISQIVSVFDLTGIESKSKRNAVIAFLFLWIYISKCYNNGSYIPCHVGVDSDLGIGAGMGSSASYSVCLSTAMLILCGRTTPRLLPEDKTLINEWAFQAERIFHGKPSGLDNAVCLYGGAVLFGNGSVTEKLPNLPDIHVLLVDTKVSRNTKQLVEKVRQKQALFPSIIDSIMDSIEYVSNNSWKLLMDLYTPSGDEITSSCSENNLEKLENLFNVNHHLLNALDVGHPFLDTIYSTARKHSCAAKLTGAGGGGCAIILLTPKIDKLAIENLSTELKTNGYDVHDVFLGCPGVQVEFHSS